MRVFANEKTLPITLYKWAEGATRTGKDDTMELFYIKRHLLYQENTMEFFSIRSTPWSSLV